MANKCSRSGGVTAFLQILMAGMLFWSPQAFSALTAEFTSPAQGSTVVAGDIVTFEAKAQVDAVTCPLRLGQPPNSEIRFFFQFSYVNYLGEDENIGRIEVLGRHNTDVYASFDYDSGFDGGPFVLQMKLSVSCEAGGAGGYKTVTATPRTVNLLNGPVTIESIWLQQGIGQQAAHALPFTISEGETVPLSVTYDDPDKVRDYPNTTFHWVLGVPTYIGSSPYSSGQPATSENQNPIVTYNDGSHQISVTVDDGDGSSDTLTRTLTVLNIPPTIDQVYVPTQVNEGSAVLLQASAHDPVDTLTYLWDFDSLPVASGAAATVTAGNQDIVTIRVTVDDGTDQVYTEKTLTIVNVPPSITSFDVPTIVPEGSVVSVSATATDPVDTLSYLWTFPGGVTSTSQNASWTSGNQGSALVGLAVSDDVATTNASRTVFVQNVPPTITTFDVPSSVDEGQTVTLSAAATDPVDAVTYAWYIGGSLVGNGPSVTYTFSKSGPIQVRLEVKDDVDTTTRIENVSVVNQPPVIVFEPVDPVDEGESVTIVAHVSDLGGTAPVLEWDFGDGSSKLRTNNATVTHTYADSGVYTVQLSASDFDGGTTVKTIDVTVINLPPVLGPIQTQTGFEGLPLNFAVTATDVAADTVTVSWDFGDGTPTAVGKNVSHTYANNGVYTVVVTATDDEGAFSTQTLDVTIQNLAPSLSDISVSQAAVEGVPVQFSVVATDVAADTLSYVWDFGDGSTPLTTPTGNATYSWPDNGTFVVTVTVTDNDNGASSRLRTVEVANVRPVITSITLPDRVDAGQPVNFAATATDVAADTLTWTWDFGDGTQEYAASGSHTWGDEGAFTVTITVRDKDGGTTTTSRVVGVGNVDLTLDPVTPPDPIVEGASVTLTASGSSFTGLPLTWSWDPGDGSPAVSGQTFQHTYADDDVYTVTVTLSDGVTSLFQTVDVTVTNLPPVPGVAHLPTTANEGELLTYSYPATDPGIHDVLTWRWLVDGVLQSENGDTLEITFPNNRKHTIEVSVSDEDGGEVGASVVTTVNNVAPTVEISGDTNDSLGPELSFHAEVFDPGDDNLMYMWNFGDGTISFDALDDVTHTYAANGTYTVELTVNDGDGGLGSDTFAVTIHGYGPVIGLFSAPTAANEGSNNSLQCDGYDAGKSGGVTISWDFGDGTTATGNIVQHVWRDDGLYAVQCTVTDLEQRSVSQSASVEIRNVAPIFVSVPPDTVGVGESLRYGPRVSDPGQLDTFIYEALQLPAGATFDPAIPELQWKPGSAQLGGHTVSLKVSDNGGASSTQTWSILVIVADQDNDGMSDPWEREHGLDPTNPNDANGDPDGDGRTNLQEFLDDTDPRHDDRPGLAALIFPVGGEHVGVARPAFEWEEAISPVGDALTYEIALYNAPGGTSAILTAAAIEPLGDGTAAWLATANLPENAMVYWRVRAADAYANGAWTPLEAFFVNAVQEPPAPPVLSSPADNALLTTTGVVLDAIVGLDPDGDTVQAAFVLLNGTGGVVDSSDLISPSAGHAKWPITQTLAAGAAYCWYAYDVDSTGLASEHSATRCFLTEAPNQPPTAPAFTAPAQDDTVHDRRPTLTLQNGTDPDGDILSVVFEIDAAETFDTLAFQSATVLAGPSGSTSWRIPVAVAEDSTVFARAAMRQPDGLQSAWVDLSFFVSETNNPPGTPLAIAPDDGWGLSTGDVTLEVSTVTDPEGTDVIYEFEVRDSTNHRIDGELGVLPASTDTVLWDLVGLTTPGTFQWRARGIDNDGIPGPWSAARTLVVPSPTGPGDTDDTDEPDTGDTGGPVDTGDTGEPEDTGEDTAPHEVDTDNPTTPDTSDTDETKSSGCAGGCAQGGERMPAGGLLAGLGAAWLLVQRRRRRG